MMTLASFPTWVQNDVNMCLGDLEAKFGDLRDRTLDADIEEFVCEWTTTNRYSANEIHLFRAGLHVILATFA